MKKVIAILLGVVLTAGAYAYDPNERVLKAFNQTFSGAEEVKWEEYPAYYVVSFVSSGIRSRVNYDKEGNILSSIRYYNPHLLPFNIFNRMTKENGSKKMFGVTEVTYGSATTYFIKMEDAKRWYTYKVDSEGSSQLIEKYNKI